MMKHLGYIRLSRSDDTSQSVEVQTKGLLKHDPGMQLFTDDGVSGEDNLIKLDGAWAELWNKFLEDPQNTVICVWAFDRLGRSFTLGAVLEQTIKLGGSIRDVSENYSYDDLEKAEQAMKVSFGQLVSQQYRADVKRKTLKAMESLKAKEVMLGTPPAVNRNELAQLRFLREEKGYSLRELREAVPVERHRRDPGSKVGLLSISTIRKILGDPNYLPYEDWQATNELRKGKKQKLTDDLVEFRKWKAAQEH